LYQTQGHPTEMQAGHDVPVGDEEVNHLIEDLLSDGDELPSDDLDDWSGFSEEEETQTNPNSESTATSGAEEMEDLLVSASALIDKLTEGERLAPAPVPVRKSKPPVPPRRRTTSAASQRLRQKRDSSNPADSFSPKPMKRNKSDQYAHLISRPDPPPRAQKPKRPARNSLTLSMEVNTKPVTRKVSSVSVIHQELQLILQDESSLFRFTEHMEAGEKQIVDFWLDCSRFMEYASSMDSAMTTNMLHNVWAAYQQKEGMPHSFHPFLQEHQKLDLADLEAQEDLISSCQCEVFDHILCHLYPKYKEQALTGPSISTSLDGVISRSDHFEAFSEDSQIVMETKKGPMVVAASIERLVVLLTSDEVEHELALAVALTTDYFLKDHRDWLKMLEHRLHRVILQFENKRDPNVSRVVLRIANAIKLWVDARPDLFHEDSTLYDALLVFIDEEIASVAEAAATNLRKFVVSRLEKFAQAPEKESKDFQFSRKPPKRKKCSYPPGAKAKELSLEDIHPLEFARQLALVDHELYRRIRPCEVLHMNWTKPESKSVKAPNILRMIEQFNRVGQFVISVILTAHDPSRRLRVLQLLIRIAYESFQLGNLNGAMAVTSGLRNSNVSRLKNTWDELSSASWDMWEVVTNSFVLNDNFASLRKIIHDTQPPLIPYLGMYELSISFATIFMVYSHGAQIFE